MRRKLLYLVAAVAIGGLPLLGAPAANACNINLNLTTTDSCGGGHCTVNGPLATCRGHCTVNAGYCDTNCWSTVNLGYCF
jgi:hypothetical protein